MPDHEIPPPPRRGPRFPFKFKFAAGRMGKRRGTLRFPRLPIPAESGAAGGFPPFPGQIGNRGEWELGK